MLARHADFAYSIDRFSRRPVSGLRQGVCALAKGVAQKEPLKAAH